MDVKLHFFNLQFLIIINSFNIFSIFIPGIIIV